MIDRKAIEKRLKDLEISHQYTNLDDGSFCLEYVDKLGGRRVLFVAPPKDKHYRYFVAKEKLGTTYAGTLDSKEGQDGLIQWLLFGVAFPTIGLTIGATDRHLQFLKNSKKKFFQHKFNSVRFWVCFVGLLVDGLGIIFGPRSAAPWFLLSIPAFLLSLLYSLYLERSR
jgi:hypothetical protein